MANNRSRILACLLGAMLSSQLTTAGLKPAIALPALGPDGVVASPDKNGVRDDAGAKAAEAGIDVGGVIETVRHHVAPVEGRPGVLGAEDDLYKVELHPRGVGLSLREELGFEQTPAFRIDVRGSGTSTWRAQYNRAERDVAPGLVERVTAKEGLLEWDFVLAAPVPGDLTVDAAITARGKPTIVKRGREGLITPALRWPLPGGRAVRMGELVVKDARGRVLHRALPRATRGGVTLEVPERALHRALYPVTLDPGVSPEYPASDPVVTSSALGSQFGPSVAWNGTSFLVVWQDTRTDASGLQDIRGTRVSPAGAVLDPGGIAIGGVAGSDQRNAAAASDGSGFLVVWEDYRNSSTTPDVFGARVSATGAVLDPSGIPVAVGATSQRTPAVAWIGSSYLISWTLFPAVAALDIFGARVSPAGEVLDPAPGIAISTATGSQDSSAVAWNGTNALVVWQDSRSGSNDIFGARVSPAGAVLDASGISISAAVNWQVVPAVSSDGTSFFVVWEDQRNPGGGDIFGARVSGSGTVLDPSGVAISSLTAFQKNPAVAWSGSSYLAVWEDGRNVSSGTDVFAARVSAAGALLDPSGIAVSTAPFAQLAPALAWGGDQFLVAWSDPRNLASSFDIYATRMSPLGAVLDADGILVGQAANEQRAPAVAWDGTNFLVVWQDLRSGANRDIFGARVSRTGALLDGAGIAISTAGGDQQSPAVAWNGTDFLVVWEDARTTGFDVFGARVSAGGAVLDPSGIPISTASSHQQAPTVSRRGAGFFVVWYEPRATSVNDIIGARIASDGTVQDPAGIVVSGAPGNQFSPAVAVHAGTLLVAWEDERNGATRDIYGARVTTAGTVLDPSGIPVSTAPGSQGSVALAQADGTFLAVWFDGRSDPAGDIFGARLTADGQVLDTTGIAVSAVGGAQGLPGVARLGESFLVTWQATGATGAADVFGARVGKDGAPQGVAFPIAAAADAEQAPAVSRSVEGRAGVVYQRFATEAPYSSVNRVFLRLVDHAEHDGFVDAQLIEGVAGSDQDVNGGAGKESGEPDHAGDPGGASVWYRWTAPGSGSVTIDTLGSDFNTLLGAYTGNFVSGLTQVAANDDSGGPQSSVTFVAHAGTVYHIAVDGSGGANGIVTLNWNLTVDATPPDTTITSGPPAAGSSTSATFAFTSTEAGSTFECALDGGPFFGCLSPRTFTGLSSAAHTFEVRATDLAGNVDSSPATWSWSVDTTPPDTLIDSGPSGATNQTTATLSFSATETGSTFTCSLDGAAFAACTSPLTTPVLGDGPHTFRARASDSFGNADPTPAERSWTVDTAAPNTQITGGPTGLTGSATATFDFTATEAGATFECSLDGGAFAFCASPKTYTGLGDGPHTFSVRATDAAGNTDATPDSRAWSVDSVGPNTTITAGPSGTVASTTASLEFTSTEAGAFECSLDGAGFTPCTSPKGYASLGQGAHLFEVRAVDGAGNADATPAGRSWAVDTVAPDTSIDSGPSGPTSQTTATFSFSATEAGSSFSCSLDGAAFAPCTSPASFLELAPGPHDLRVRATDAAGNPDATPSLRSFTVDTAAPDTQITSGPPRAANTGEATFGFSSSEPGSSFACSLDGAPFAFCTPPRTYTGLPDGSHTLQVRATDPAGNADPTPDSRTWTIDTAPPDTTITTAPSGTVASTSATFGFTSPEAGATFECSLDGAGFSACTSPTSYAALSQGPHAFDVRAVDGAGNRDPTPARRSWAVDTVAPDTAIDSAPPALTNQTSATFAFSATEAGATFTCSLDGAAYSACSSPLTHTALADGSHTFRVRATDAQGNTDSTPAQHTWTVDTAAPETQIISGPSGVTSATAATFGFASSESGGSFACSLDGAAFTPCVSPKTYAGLGDGSHAFEARATDAAGNTDASPASRTWRVDTTPPDTAITAGPPAATSSTAATFEFTATEAGSVFECALDGGPFAACSSPKAYGGLADGAHIFDVRAVDPAGNADASPARRSWTVDTAPPETAIDSKPSTLTNQTSATFTFSATEPGSSFACSLDGAAFSACSSPVTHTSLADGPHTFRVRATDAQGNTDATPAQHTWTVDTAAPETQISSGPLGVTSATSATFEFASTEPGSSFACSLDAGAFGPCASPATYSGLANGSHTFRARATDAAGNTDATPAVRSWTVDTVPPDTTITSGPADGTIFTSSTFEFSASEPGSAFQCSLDGEPFSLCSSPHSYGGLSPAAHVFRVRAVDGAGNIDPTPASWMWTIIAEDRTPPEVTIIRPVAGLYVNDSPVATGGPMPVTVGGLTVIARANDLQSRIASFAFEVDGTPVASTYDPGTDTYRFILGASPGTHTVVARAMNGASLAASHAVQILVVI